MSGKSETTSYRLISILYLLTLLIRILKRSYLILLQNIYVDNIIVFLSIIVHVTYIVMTRIYFFQKTNNNVCLNTITYTVH